MIAALPRPTGFFRHPLTQAILLCVLAGGVVGVLSSALNPFVGAGALIAAGVVVAALSRPTGRFWLLSGVISLLPFGVIPFKLGVQLTLLDATLALLLGIALLRFLGRGQPGISTPLDLPVLIYVAFCFISFVRGATYGINSETIKYFIKVAAAILLYFALTNGLTRRRALRSFVDSLILGSFASAAIAVGLYLAGQQTAQRLLSALAPLGYPAGAGVLRFIASTKIWRATSTSVDPNIFGGLLMIGIVLLVGRLLGRGHDSAERRVPSAERRIVDEGAEHRVSSAEDVGSLSAQHSVLSTVIPLAMLALMAWALLLSYSRGAWVGTAVGILFLVLLHYRKLVPLLLVLGAVMVFTLGQSDFGQHLVSGFLVEDKASAMRLGEYKDAVNFIAEYPFFGVGFGTTPSGSAVTPDIDIYVGVSNIYLLMALEIGLVGMAAFALVVITLVGWTWRRYRSADPAGQAWIATAAAALVSAGVAGIADHYFFRFPHMIALFWALVAILVVAGRLATTKADPSKVVSPGG